MDWKMSTEEKLNFFFLWDIWKYRRIKIPNSTLIKIVCQLKIIEDGKIKLLFSFGYLKILEINVLKLLICGLKNIEDGKDGEEIRFLFFMETFWKLHNSKNQHIKIVFELKIIKDREEIKFLFSFGKFIYLKILKINVLKLHMIKKRRRKMERKLNFFFFTETFWKLRNSKINILKYILKINISELKNMEGKWRGKRNRRFYLWRTACVDFLVPFLGEPSLLRAAASIAGNARPSSSSLSKGYSGTTVEGDHGRSHKRSLAKRYNLRSALCFPFLSLPSPHSMQLRRIEA